MLSKKGSVVNWALFACVCFALSWCIVGMQTSAMGDTNCEDCTKDWDCETTCICTEWMQKITGFKDHCYRACNDVDQTDNKHECEPAQGETCPDETEQDCGILKSKIDYNKVEDCPPGSWPTFTDCTDEAPTTVTGMACD